MSYINYFYSSTMENAHGFATYVPHAYIFHPYFGLLTFNMFVPNMMDMYHPLFKSKLQNRISKTVKHKIKIFFPEIREGLIRLDKVKYSVISDTKDTDNVSVDYTILTKSNYIDYLEIKNNILELEIGLKIDTIYNGLVTSPTEIVCDYVEFMLKDERISINITTNTIKLIPYIAAVRDVTHIIGVKSKNNKSLIDTNTNPMYMLYLKHNHKKTIEDFGIKTIDMLNTMWSDMYSEGTDVIGIRVPASVTQFAIEDDIINETRENSDNILPILDSYQFAGSEDVMCKAGNQSNFYPYIYGLHSCFTAYGAKCNCSNDVTPLPYEQVVAMVFGKIMKEISIADDKQDSYLNKLMFLLDFRLKEEIKESDLLSAYKKRINYDRLAK